MKFQEYAHHLFDAIRRQRVMLSMRDLNDERLARGNLARRLPEFERTPLYVLRDPADVIADRELSIISREWVREGRLALPFPKMMLQVVLTDTIDPESLGVKPANDVWIILATREDSLPDLPEFKHFISCVGPGDPNSFWVQMFETTIDALDEWIQPGAFVRVGNGDLRGYATDQLAGTPDDMREHARRVNLAAGFLCCVLAMLDSPSVELEAVKIPKEVNRGRSLIKKSRIPDHTVIRLPKIVYAQSGGHQGGTHRRPRTHWRRPHKREIKPGKFVDIPLTLVAKVEGQPPPPAPVVELVTRKEPT
jgi:hypothetical protein